MDKITNDNANTDLTKIEDISEGIGEAEVGNEN